MDSRLAMLIGFLEWIFGWRSERGEGSILGVGVSEDGQFEFDQVLPAEGVLAYTVEDDSEWIYVVTGQDERAAATLKAEVKDDIWTFNKNDEEIRRKKKEVPPPRIGNGVSFVAKIVPIGGFLCVTVPKGKLLPIYKQVSAWGNRVKYKKISKYKVPETADYCVYTGNSRDSCPVLYRDVKGRYKDRTKYGTWRWKTRTRKLGKC